MRVMSAVTESVRESCPVLITPGARDNDAGEAIPAIHGAALEHHQL
jgi:hypothetical protein